MFLLRNKKDISIFSGEKSALPVAMNYAKILNTIFSDRMIYEPVHDQNNKTCGTSKDSDQLAHLGSLIRVFADHVPSKASRLSKDGQTRALAILGGCTG